MTHLINSTVLDFSFTQIPLKYLVINYPLETIVQGTSVVYLWIGIITFGGRSANLAYRVHKGSRKTSIIIIIIIEIIVDKIYLSLLDFQKG